MSEKPITFAALESALARPAGPATSDFDGSALRQMPQARLRPAAVLLPVVERPHGLGLVLTRRAAALKHHGGQIALPGGKREPGDPDLIQTALREAEEEIGLAQTAARVMGRLAPHQTVTGFEVTPVLAEIDPRFRPVPDPGEVDEVFEVPLAHLMSEQNQQWHRRVWQGQERRYPAIPYGPYYVWGATARILLALTRQMALDEAELQPARRIA